MRKLIITEFMTLDGVIQAPGGPEEDTSGGFAYGGWTVPYSDDFTGKIMTEQMKPPFDLLLGRKTYEIWEAYWPAHSDQWPGINEAKKYVASHQDRKFDWENSFLLRGDVAEAVKKLKAED